MNTHGRAATAPNYKIVDPRRDDSGRASIIPESMYDLIRTTTIITITTTNHELTRQQGLSALFRTAVFPLPRKKVLREGSQPVAYHLLRHNHSRIRIHPCFDTEPIAPGPETP